MTEWTVYDQDGEIVAVDVRADNVTQAIAQFSYANDLWHATPQRVSTYEELTDKAEALGYDHGSNVGSWVIDGNTSDETKRRIIAGYEDGDPEIMDMPPSPLSGEWAGDPVPNDVLRELGVDPEDDISGELLTAYENGFSTGYWDSVITLAKL